VRARLLLLLFLVPGCAQGAPTDRGDAATARADAGDAPDDDGGMPGDDAGPVERDAGDCEGPERCNGLDDDCDDRIDEQPEDGTTYHRDLDGDGFGSDTDTIVACEMPDNAVATGGDCADGSNLVNPDSPETCDGLDNDCAGGVDDAGCPAGCTGVPFGGHGYLFCDGDLAWDAARAACDAAGLRLVRVDTTAENDFLWATASTTIGDFFIGARVESGATVWRWVDGTELWDGILGGSAVGGVFAAWEADQPDDNGPPSCAVARDRMMGLWHDTSCTTPNDYVCERY